MMVVLIHSMIEDKQTNDAVVWGRKAQLVLPSFSLSLPPKEKQCLRIKIEDVQPLAMILPVFWYNWYLCIEQMSDKCTNI